MNKLRNRMLLIGLIPLLGLIWATVTTYFEEQAFVHRLEVVVPLTGLAVKSGNLVHELQNERGSQVGLISSGGAAKFRAAVDEQRGRTDDSVRAFESYLDAFELTGDQASLVKILDHARELLGRLSQHRQAVDGGQIGVPRNVEYYTAIVYDLIDIIAIVQEKSPEPSVTQRLLAYRALVWAKEFAGLERAIGAAILNKGAFDATLWARYLGLVEKQKAYMHDFHVYTTPEEERLFAETVSGPAVDQVLAWREVILALGSGGDSQGIDGADWFAKATRRINALKKVEDSLGQEVAALAAERLHEVRSHAYLIVGVDIVVLIAALLIGGLILRATARPLQRVTNELLAVAAGKSEIDLPDRIGGGDEVRALAEAAKTFLANRLERARLTEEADALQASAESKRKAALEEMAGTVRDEAENALSEVRGTAETLSNVSGRMGDAARNIADNADDMRSAADRSLQSTETAAAAAEELSASIAEITRQIDQQRAIAVRATEEANRSSKTVEGLNDAASRIGDVIDLIQDIAEQTNLLALNATIEASRAGEAGKGFAVVASEVKNLANQTAKATEEISQQVNTMTDVTVDSTKAIHAIVSVIGEMSEISRLVSDAVEQQSSASQEITGNVVRCTDMSREVSDRIKEVTTATEESRHLVETLGSCSSDVVRNTEAMRSRIVQAVEEAAVAA